MATTAELIRAGNTTCPECSGQLCVADAVVRCDVCGMVDESHPLTVAGRNEKPVVPAAPIVRLDEFAAGYGDRILRLEGAIKQLSALVAELAARATHQESRRKT